MKVLKVRERNVDWYELEVEIQRGLILTKRLSESEVKALRDSIVMALKSGDVQEDEV